MRTLLFLLLLASMSSGVWAVVQTVSLMHLATHVVENDL